MGQGNLQMRTYIFSILYWVIQKIFIWERCLSRTSLLNIIFFLPMIREFLCIFFNRWKLNNYVAQHYIRGGFGCDENGNELFTINSVTRRPVFRMCVPVSWNMPRTNVLFFRKHVNIAFARFFFLFISPRLSQYDMFHVIYKKNKVLSYLLKWKLYLKKRKHHQTSRKSKAVLKKLKPP